MPSALVSAASGIGDIIRVTPLVRVFRRLGYEVDILVSPDDLSAADLLRGAPELRNVFVMSRISGDAGISGVNRLRSERYDVATFTALSAPLGRFVDAVQRYSFDAAWRINGDSASVERIARSIGWTEPMPQPFAMKSSRRFRLPKGTIALHPGCKLSWPWKKWHGFDELAALLPSAAVIGTGSDLDNSHTYFAHPFRWPHQVHNFVGKLALRDTAALISQCAALISPDSGMMHLGVALGVRTFGVFGITSPVRECIPSPYMVPITKGLECESHCRTRPWGRRDCARQLACLKMLTAQEVAARVAAAI